MTRLSLITALLLVTTACLPFLKHDDDDSGADDDSGGLDDSGVDGDTCASIGGVTVTLDSVATVASGATWTENDVTLTLGEHGGGFWGEAAGGCVMFGGKITADLSGLPCSARTVYVDVLDWCGQDCTEAHAFAGTTEVASDTNGTTTGSATTLELRATGADITEVWVGTYEGEVCELRFE